MKKCFLALSVAAVVVFGAVVSTGNVVLAEEAYGVYAVCAEPKGEAVLMPLSSTLPDKPVRPR